MSIFDRLDRWHEQDAISAQQHALFTALIREEPFSIFTELNLLLYAGVLAFVAGLGWTVTTFSRQIGDVAIIALLSASVAASLWFCFRRAPAWSLKETASSSLFADYVLYLCCLVWCIELAYLEQRLFLPADHWNDYLLATAAFFLFLAYRFDNRFILSLAFSSLAGWFGLTFSHLSYSETATYRLDGLLYCALVLGIGAGLRFLRIKPHFFSTYLNVVANVLFLALLSGVLDSESRSIWFFALLVASAASLAWGIQRRQFAFVVYAFLYTYIGGASLFFRADLDPVGTSVLLLLAAVAGLVMLVVISRRFGETP